MADITPQLADTLGLNNSLLFLLALVDEKKITPTFRLLLIRVKRDYHDLWKKHLLFTDPTLSKDHTKLQAALAAPCPVDEFDSGVIYLLTGPEGNESARVVCRSDDYPYVTSMQATLARAYLEKANETSELREWLQGSVIRVFTIETEASPMTFYASRTKIDCVNSRWVNDPSCPRTKEAFMKACVAHGIREIDLQTPGTCHVFLFRHPFNQITNLNVAEPGVIIHIRSYQFGEASYLPLNVNIEGAQSVRKLSLDEAVEVVKRGGVVMTTNAFRNTKYMLDETSTLFSWMEGDPVRTWMKLNGQSPQDVEIYMRHLQPWALERIEKARAGLEQNMASTAEYLYMLSKISLRKGEHPALEEKGIRVAIKHLAAKYREAREAAIAAGTFDPQPKLKKGKKQAGKMYKPVFFLGVTQEDTKLKEIRILSAYLEGLLKQNGDLLIGLINKCARFSKQDAYRLAKASGQQREPELEVFIPIQIDCSDLDGDQ